MNSVKAIKHDKNYNYHTKLVTSISFSDPLNAEYILTHCGIKPLTELLKLTDLEILADTITTLLQLDEYQSSSDFHTEEVIKNICSIQKSNDRRLVNLATIFLQHVSSKNEHT